MKKLLLMLPVLALAACANLDTPEDHYLATINLATVTIDGATAYAEDCANYKPKGHACEAVVLKLEEPMNLLAGAKAEATKVVVTRDSPYYDLAKSALENAIDKVRNILIGAQANG